MTKSQHTPKLWTLSENVNDTQDLPFTEYCIEDEDQEIVFFTRNKCHAALIVKAVNEREGLIEALRDLLGDRPSVQRGICHHCARDYTGDFLEGDCPSDDCPSFNARAILAKAEAEHDQHDQGSMYELIRETKAEAE